MSFPDHFSGHADLYRRFRPTYPDALYGWLGHLVGEVGPGPGGGAEAAEEALKEGGPFDAGGGRGHARGHRAWDCATGSGQAATGLAGVFGAVIGTDASLEQLRRARPHRRVRYVAALAERTPFPAACLDLVTVAQAVHWFRLPDFWEEVRRVVRPGGVVAVWTYELFSVEPAVDEVIRWFYSDVVGPDWPPERRLVEDAYRSLPFPFDEIDDVPDFVMRPRWSRDDLLGQVGTWSAVRRHRERTGSDPVERLATRIVEAWPDGDEHREVTWPLRLRVGRLEPG